MKATVIRTFKCKITRQTFEPADIYESDDPARIEFLQQAGYLEAAPPDSNKPDAEYPKHVGGGMYELPDGERIRGKQAAIDAMNGGD